MTMHATLPGFTGEMAVELRGVRYAMRTRSDGEGTGDDIVAAVPMGYCKTVCAWRVCGSALPGYPEPMCYSCEQECWLHDSGSYAGYRSIS